MLALGMARYATPDDGSAVLQAPGRAQSEVQSSEIDGLSATSDREGTTLEVALTDPTPVDGFELFVWRLAGTPVAELRFADGEWHADDHEIAFDDDGVVRIELDIELAEVAVSTAGHRSPVVGHVVPSPDGGDVVVIEGDGAAVIEKAVATAQAGYALLDPEQRAVARSLLSRQLMTGTATYTAATEAGVATVVVTVDYPTISQVSTDERGGVVALRVDADAIRSCRGATCTVTDTYTVPATAAAAMAAAPEAVTVTPLPDGQWNGEPTTCMGITSALDDGPTPGTSCWLADGTLVEADRENGIVTRLVSR